jgi:3' exoribonuclease, RNase T-like
MRIFYDTEFIEDGWLIGLISIGMVREDGAEYYAVNLDADWLKIANNNWLCENVVPSLPLREPVRLASAGPARFRFAIDRDSSSVKRKQVIADEVRDFILAAPDPQLWAWYAAYDHVALCQLWGRMIDLPDGVPMWTNDLKQEAERLGSPRMPEQESGEHNALADARHVKVMAGFLDELT